jgi:hypothetical protein
MVDVPYAICRQKGFYSITRKDNNIFNTDATSSILRQTVPQSQKAVMSKQYVFIAYS